MYLAEMNVLKGESITLLLKQGLKLRPIQSHLRLKYLEKSQICDLFSSLLFQNKRVRSCHFAALLFLLFCFLP